jgi:DNA-binding phage protein
MTNFDDAVKIAAIKKKKNLAAIAKTMCITRSALTQMISGNPTKANIDRIAAALDMKSSELIALGEDQ